MNQGVRNEKELRPCKLDAKAVIDVLKGGPSLIEPANCLMERAFDPNAAASCIR
jgi:hypothetical protein